MKKQNLAAAQPADPKAPIQKGTESLLSLLSKFRQVIEKEDDESIKSILNEAGEDLLALYSSYNDSLRVKQILEAYKKHYPGKRINISHYFCDIAKNYGETGILLAEQLIFQGDDLNSITNNGYTVLHYLAKAGKLDLLKPLVDLMVKNNMSVDPEAPDGYTPLSTAIYDRHANIVECLAPHSKVICTVTTTGFSALHLAAEKGFDEIITTLLLYCDKTAVHVLTKPHLLTPLHMAVHFGKTKAVHLLVEHAEKHNESVNLPSPPPNHGETPLHSAAKFGFLGCVKRLVRALNFRQENINPRTEILKSPFEFAVDSLHLNIIEFYLNHKKFDPSNIPLPRDTIIKIIYAAIDAKNESIVENLINTLYNWWQVELFSEHSIAMCTCLCLALLFRKDDKALIEVLEGLFSRATTPQEDQIVDMYWSISLEQVMLQGRVELTEMLFNTLKNRITRKEMIILCSPLANKRPSTQAQRSLGKLLAQIIKEEKEVSSFVHNTIHLLKEKLGKIRPAGCMPGNEEYLQNFQEAYDHLQHHIEECIESLESLTDENLSSVKEKVIIFEQTLSSLSSSYQSKKSQFLSEEEKIKKEIQNLMQKQLQPFENQLRSTQQFLSTMLRPFLSNREGTISEREQLRTLRKELAETQKRCQKEIDDSQYALLPTLEETFAALSIQEQGLHRSFEEIKNADELRKKHLAEEQVQKEFEKVKIDIVTVISSLEKMIIKIRNIVLAAESNLSTIIPHADEASLLRIQALQHELASLNTEISEKKSAITAQENAQLDLKSSKGFLSNLYVMTDDLAQINILAVALTARVSQEFSPLSAKLIEEKEALKQATLQKIQTAQLSFNGILQHVYYKNSVEKNKEHSLFQSCDKYKQAAAKLAKLTEPVLNEKSPAALQNILAGIETSIKKEEANIAVLVSQLDDQLATDLLGIRIEQLTPLYNSASVAATQVAENSGKQRNKKPKAPPVLAPGAVRIDSKKLLNNILNILAENCRIGKETDTEQKIYALLCSLSIVFDSMDLYQAKEVRNAIFHCLLTVNISEDTYEQLFKFSRSLFSPRAANESPQEIVGKFFDVFPKESAQDPARQLDTVEYHINRLKYYGALLCAEEGDEKQNDPLTQINIAFSMALIGALMADLDKASDPNDQLSIAIGSKCMRLFKAVNLTIPTFHELANTLRHEGPPAIYKAVDSFCLSLAKSLSLESAPHEQSKRRMTENRR